MLIVFPSVNKLFVENAKDTISDNPKMIRDGWTVPVSMAAVRALLLSFSRGVGCSQSFQYGLLSNIFGNGTIVNKWGLVLLLHTLLKIRNLIW